MRKQKSARIWLILQGSVKNLRGTVTTVWLLPETCTFRSTSTARQTALLKCPLANSNINSRSQMKPNGPDTQRRSEHIVCRPSSWELQEAHLTSHTNTVELYVGVWSWTYRVFTSTIKKVKLKLASQFDSWFWWPVKNKFDDLVLLSKGKATASL